MARNDRRTAGNAGRTGRARHGRRTALIGRSLTTLALLPLASRLPSYGRLTLDLLADERVSVARKAILAGAVGYAISPLDLIPDRVPVLGAIDDLVVGVLGVELFLAGISRELIDEKLDRLGIPRAAFEEDRARVRRTIPRPVRRIVNRLPATLESAGRITRDLELGRHVRGWLTKEGSPA
jgi:uncharacterized membrane protein YkvA (DUF1232 family)